MYKYDFQQQPHSITVYRDTDFAGCTSTRRSTSGGVCLHGKHNIKHCSKTQTTVCLSSGESELRGISDGLAQALGIQTIARDLGLHWPIKIYSDATAAIGIATRRGMGRIRHLDVTDLWVQEKFTTKAATIDKVLSTENPADIFTKHVNKSILTSALHKMGMELIDGRSAVAPQAARVQNQLLNKRHRRLLTRGLKGKKGGQTLLDMKGIVVTVKANHEPTIWKLSLPWKYPAEFAVINSVLHLITLSLISNCC